MKPPASAGGALGLGDLIARTADEIRRARDAAPKDDPVLTLTECEVKLAVTVSAEGGGGLKVWLLDLSAKAKAEQVSTVTLKFGPAGGKPLVFLTQSGADSAPVDTQNRAARSE